MRIGYHTNLRNTFAGVAAIGVSTPRSPLSMAFKAAAPDTRSPLQKITPPKTHAAMKVAPLKVPAIDKSKPVSQGLIKDNQQKAKGTKAEITKAQGVTAETTKMAKAQIVDAMKQAASAMPEIGSGAVNSLTATQSQGDVVSAAGSEYADPTQGAAGAIVDLVRGAQTPGSHLEATLYANTLDVLQQGAPQENFMMMGGDDVQSALDWSGVTVDDLTSILFEQSPEMNALNQAEFEADQALLTCAIAQENNNDYLANGTPDDIRIITGQAGVDVDAVNIASSSLSGICGTIAGTDALSPNTAILRTLTPTVDPTTPSIAAPSMQQSSAMRA